IGKEIAQHADYSDDTAQRIDGEIQGLLNEGLSTAREILTKEREKLDSLTEALMEKETLDDEEIRHLWGMDSWTDARSENADSLSEEELGEE
ncbi:MAG: cell division protein FtsH, partial [Spirochaetales bacterium]|nr:cell division protein FtsH [Spirochaetales bacterium]